MLNAFSNLLGMGKAFRFYRVSDGVLTPVVSPTLLGTRSQLIHNSPADKIKRAPSRVRVTLPCFLKLGFALILCYNQCYVELISRVLTVHLKPIRLRQKDEFAARLFVL